jgi:hypothetical protein
MRVRGTDREEMLELKKSLERAKEIIRKRKPCYKSRLIIC